MIKQAKNLLKSISFHENQTLIKSPISLFYLQSNYFSETKKLFHPEKETPCLTKIKKQFLEAEKYLRKKSNLEEAIKRYQDILYSFNFSTVLKPRDGLKALIGMGDALILQKKIDRGLDYYLLALAFYPLNNSDFQRGVLCQKIGECYFELNDQVNSLEYFQKSLDLYKTSNIEDNSQIGKIKIFLGNIFYHKNDYFQAMEHYKEALDILPQYEENNYLVIQAKTQVAKILVSMKEQWTSWTSLYEAMTLYEETQGLSNSQKIEIIEEFIKALEPLGFIQELLERYEQLLQLLRQEEESESVNKKTVQTLVNIAETLFYMKKIPKAIQGYERALEEIERFELDEMKGNIYLQLGLCYLIEVDNEKAVDYLFKAIANKKEFCGANNVEIGKAYYYIGRVYYIELDYEESEKYFAKALRILRKHYDEDYEDILEVQKYLNKARQKLSDD